MPEGRAKRQTKTPSKYASDNDVGGKQQKHVFRLLQASEISKDLQDEAVFLLWPEDAKWYPAEIRKVDVRKKKADLFYTTTNEEETVDLTELIDQKSIAFRESRALSHKLKPDEVWDSEDAEENPKKAKRGPLNDPEEEPEVSSEAEEDSNGGEDEETSEHASADEDQQDEEEPLRDIKPSSSTKRQREHVASPEEVQGRPKRQITLSNKARELMSDSQAAQLQNILQGRDMAEAKRLETAAIQIQQKEPGRVEDKFSSAEAYEQRLLAQIAGGGGRPEPLASRQSAQKVGSLRESQFYGGKPAAPSKHDHEVRTKAVEQMKLALEKVLQEKPQGSWPDPGESAKSIETALFNLYGHVVEKDYKAKYRSLIFNLRDAANPDLRARVLGGEIAPSKLVQLSAVELASKELASWREEKEKEQMKNAVLDEAVASKFSTAAALASKRSENRGVDWRDNTLATNSPPRENPKPAEVTELAPPKEELSGAAGGEGVPSGPRASQTTPSQSTSVRLATQDSVKSPAVAGDDSAADVKGPGIQSRTSTTFDWSSIKASTLKGLDQLPPPATDAAVEAEDDGDGSEQYSPKSELSEEPKDSESEIKELAHQLSVAHSLELSERLWTGLLGNACPIPLPVSIDYLAGNPAQAAALPHRQVDVKGRVELTKVADFMKGLKNSRSRAISLAAVRLSSAASAEEKAQFEELNQQYTIKERCAVFPQHDIEYYLMPEALLSKALQQTAGRRRLPEGNLLLASVHPKNLKLPARGPAVSHQTATPQSHATQAAALASPGQSKPSPGHHAATQDAESAAVNANVTKPSGTQETNPEQKEDPESKAVTQTANTLAAALSSDQFNDTVGDPRLSAAGKSKEEIAKELMIPQGIDLSSLGSLAAALGVTQGLQDLANFQQGSEQQGGQQIAGDPRSPQSQPMQDSQAVGLQNPTQGMHQLNFQPPPEAQRNMQNPAGGFPNQMQIPQGVQDAQQPLPGPPNTQGVRPWGMTHPGPMQEAPRGPPVQHFEQQMAHQPYGNPGMGPPGPHNPEIRPQRGQTGPAGGFQQQPPPQFMPQQGPHGYPGPQYQQPNQMPPPPGSIPQQHSNQVQNPIQMQNPNQLHFQPGGPGPYNPSSHQNQPHNFQQSFGGSRPQWNPNDPNQGGGHLPGPPMMDQGPRNSPRPKRGGRGWRSRGRRGAQR